MVLMPLTWFVKMVSFKLYNLLYRSLEKWE